MRVRYIKCAQLKLGMLEVFSSAIIPKLALQTCTCYIHSYYNFVFNLHYYSIISISISPGESISHYYSYIVYTRDAIIISGWGPVCDDWYSCKACLFAAVRVDMCRRGATGLPFGLLHRKAAEILLGKTSGFPSVSPVTRSPAKTSRDTASPFETVTFGPNLRRLNCRQVQAGASTIYQEPSFHIYTFTLHHCPGPASCNSPLESSIGSAMMISGLSISALRVSRVSCGMYSAGKAARHALNPRRGFLEIARQGRPWVTPVSRRVHICQSMSSPTEEGRSSWRPFEEARSIVQALGIVSQEDYMVWARSAKRPKDVPMSPEVVYEDEGWESWDDWLGRNSPIPGNLYYSKWRSFEETRNFTRRLGLTSKESWKEWCRLLESAVSCGDVPDSPQFVYKESWQGWDDWLGTDSPDHEPPYRDYLDAREFARDLGLESKIAWKEWAEYNLERPLDVPFFPNLIYDGAGWTGWDDFLGSCPVVEILGCAYLSYDRDQVYGEGLQINIEDEWNEWAANAKLPVGIPNSPKDPKGSQRSPEDVYEGSGWVDKETFLLGGTSDDEQDPPEQQHPEN